MTWHFVFQIVCIVHVLCMTLSSILILTIGHDSVPECVCLCAHVLACMYVHACVYLYMRVMEADG